MARHLYQLSSVQQTFQARIEQKISENKQATQDRIAEIPLLGGLLAPVAGLVFDIEQWNNQYKGERGEEKILDLLIRSFPDTWVIFHNAIVEARPDTFVQIDNLFIGSAGLFLIETKAWGGSYTAYRDEWKQRKGRHWEACSSPTKQAQRHAYLTRVWLDQFWNLTLPKEIHALINPLVVFTRADWLRASNCTVPVFDGSRSLLDHLKTRTESILTPEHVSAIADLFIRTPQPPQKIRIHPQQAPLCPRCATTMVLRTAKQGSNQGRKFYGCTNYPRCREILPYQP